MNKYSQALFGNRENHAVGWLPLLLHLSVELLIQRFTSVCWSATLWFGWKFENGDIERDSKSGKYITALFSFLLWINV